MKLFSAKSAGSFSLWEIYESYEKVAYLFNHPLPFFLYFTGRATNQAQDQAITITRVKHHETTEH